jgi:hypothetical protein
MGDHSRTGTIRTRVPELVYSDAGVRQVALQRPLNPLTWLNRESIGGMIVGSPDRVASEPKDAGWSEPSARKDKGRGFDCGGESNSVYDAIMQHGDDDVIPVMVVDHQHYLTTGPGSGARVRLVSGAANRGKQQKEKEVQAWHATRPVSELPPGPHPV